jgi:sulfonate transport system substrate-binding protein
MKHYACNLQANSQLPRKVRVMKHMLANRNSTTLTTAALVIILAAGMIGCSQHTSTPKVIRLDFAFYNPLSLVLKDKHFLEDDLAKDGITVEWTQSMGSNTALDALKDKRLDFGSTAGVAALIGRANGNPIKAIYVFSRPEWTALLVRSDSSITTIEELKGKKVAVTPGTDPHVFLLRSLDEAGLSDKDIQLLPMPHAAGKAALEKGDVDAWAGLDPLMAQSELEHGSKLFHRDVSINTYGVLDVREEFAAQYPQYVRRVLMAYEKARLWAVQNPDEFQRTIAQNAKLTDTVAAKVLERTDLSPSVIGNKHKTTIAGAGDVLMKSGIIKSTTDVKATVDELVDPQYARDISPLALD